MDYAVQGYSAVSTLEQSYKQEAVCTPLMDLVIIHGVRRGLYFVNWCPMKSKAEQSRKHHLHASGYTHYGSMGTTTDESSWRIRQKRQRLTSAEDLPGTCVPLYGSCRVVTHNNGQKVLLMHVCRNHQYLFLEIVTNAIGLHEIFSTQNRALITQQSFFIVARKKMLMRHRLAPLLRVSTGRQVLVPGKCKTVTVDKLYHANIVSVKQELRELGLGTSVITATRLMVGTLDIQKKKK